MRCDDGFRNSADQLEKQSAKNLEAIIQPKLTTKFLKYCVSWYRSLCSRGPALEYTQEPSSYPNRRDHGWTSQMARLQHP
jgi:hypothetical protein